MSIALKDDCQVNSNLILPTKITKYFKFVLNKEEYLKMNTVINITEKINEEEKLLKIISWNVNGLQSVLKTNINGIKNTKINNENILNSMLIENDPDILCLQEIRCSGEFNHKLWLTNFKYQYINYCLIKKGYSGTLICSKIEPQSVKYGFGELNIEEKEGRIITLEYNNFYLINVYVPNSGSDRLEYRTNVWDVNIIRYILYLQEKKSVILIGDLNVVHTILDTCKPNNLISAGSTIEEKESFTKLLNETNMIDTLRYLHPQSKYYTWYPPYMRRFNFSNRLGCRLDYCLVSKLLIDNIIESTILNYDGSDHIPIIVTLKLTN
jgi:exodeoxyribonuclease-3